MKFYNRIRSLSTALLLASLAGCAAQRLASPAQLPQLPQDRGTNTGSIIPPSRWQYLGSDTDSHQFNYYHCENNVYLTRRVLIPRDSATLHFPEFPASSDKKWVTLGGSPTKFDFETYREPLLHPAGKKSKQPSTP